MKRKEVETLLHNERINAYIFFKLDTVQKFLEFFNNIVKRHPDAITIKIDLNDISNTFDHDELKEIDIFFTKRALETDLEFKDRVEVKMKNDRIKFEQMKEEYGWK